MKRVISLIMSLCMLLISCQMTVAAEDSAVAVPAIINNTWKAMPGDAIGIYGSNFKTDGETDVVLIPLSMYNAEDDAQNEAYLLNVLSCENNIIYAELPQDIINDAYIGFVKAGATYSKPFYINMPSVDWISEREVCAGQRVRVFGRNFLNPQTGDKTNVKAMFYDETGNFIPCEVVAATEYTIDVIAPENLTVGKKYDICINNGTSEYYSLLFDEDITEEESVVAMPSDNFEKTVEEFGIEIGWASKLKLDETFDVTKYGAKGDGASDDTQAFADAFKAAESAGGGIIYIPEGTYNLTALTNGITIPDNTVLQGAGKDKSVLLIEKRISSAQNYSGMSDFSMVSTNARSEIKAGERMVNGLVGSLIHASGKNVHFFVKNIDLKVKDGSSVSGYEHAHLAIEDCSFDISHQGPMAWNKDTRTDTKFRFVNNYVRNTQRSMIWCSDHTWIEENHFEGANGGENCEKNNDGNVDSMEHRISEMWGDKIYYGNNLITGYIGDIRDNKEDNSGEGICNQAYARMAYSKAVEATETTLKTSLDLDLIKEGKAEGVGADGKHIVGAKIAICTGNGLGQIRRIVSVDGDTLTVDRAWDVIPQKDDIFIIDGEIAEKYIIVDNDIQAATRKGGIMLFNASADNIIAGNKMDKTGGIWFGKVQNSAQRRNAIAFYNFVEGNQLSGGIPEKSIGGRSNALSIGTGDDGGSVTKLDAAMPATAHFANEYRNNTIIGNGIVVNSNSESQKKYTDYNGIVLSTSEENSFPFTKGTILSNNTVQNSVNGITMSKTTWDTLLYKNSFTKNGKDYNDAASKNTLNITESTSTLTALTEGKPTGISELTQNTIVIPKGISNDDEGSNEGKDEKYSFSDIENHWARDDIEELTKTGLIDGIGNDLFAPDKTISVAEFVTLVTRAMKLNYQNYTYRGFFVNISKDKWYSKAMEQAYMAGLIDKNMISNHTINAEKAILREEMASVVVRALDYFEITCANGDLSKYSDSDNISHWAVDYFKKASGAGIFKGDDLGRLNAKNTATRAEATIVLKEFLLEINK